MTDREELVERIAIASATASCLNWSTMRDFTKRVYRMEADSIVTALFKDYIINSRKTGRDLK